jgi:hypothetical protein
MSRKLVQRLLITLGLLAVVGVVGVVVLGNGKTTHREVPRRGCGAGQARCLPACTRTVGPSTDLSSALRAASGGAVICLTSGSYTVGTTLSGVTPASAVTLEPASGATVTLPRALILRAPIQNLTITGFHAPSNIAGGIAIVSSGGSVKQVAITYDNFDGAGHPGDAQLVLRDTARGSDIQIAHNTFTDVSPCPETCSEATIELANTAADNGPDGVTIQGNLISGGLADGIQWSGSESGTRVLNNEITGKLQASPAQCDVYGGNCPHTDAMQFVGSSRNVVVSGNYVHNDTDAILQADGSNTNPTVTNNVLAVVNANIRAVQVAGWKGGTFTHNTVSSAATWDCTHDNACSAGITLTNNVFMGGFGYGVQTGGGQFSPEAYNLTASCPHACGPHDIVGKPTFKGGPSPTSYPGWQLAPQSLGVGNSSEGTNRGVSSFSSTPGPGKPPAPASGS